MESNQGQASKMQSLCLTSRFIVSLTGVVCAASKIDAKPKMMIIVVMMLVFLLMMLLLVTMLVISCKCWRGVGTGQPEYNLLPRLHQLLVT